MKFDDKETIRKFLQKRWVLIVEPNQNYRSSIKQYLSNLRITNIVVTSSPDDALQKLSFLAHEWGLLIAEWNLPGTNGLQFCRKLRAEKRFRDIAFLLISVENLKRDVVLATEVGVDGYLLKPFCYEEFTSHLDRIARTRLLKNDVNRMLDEGEKAFAKSQYPEAQALFAQAKAAKPDSARALLGLARVAVAVGSEDKALLLLEDSIRCNPQFIDAYKELCRIFEQRHHTQDVLRVVTILHDLSPDNPIYVLKLASAHLNLREFEASEKYFRKAIRLSPRLAEAFKGLGDCFMLQEDYEKAMENYHKALDLDNNDASLLNSIGLTYVRIGRIPDGIKKYFAALKLSPDNPGILFNIGYAYEKMEDLINAKRYYMQALEIDPKFTKPQRRLGYLARGVVGAQDSDADEALLEHRAITW